MSLNLVLAWLAQVVPFQGGRGQDYGGRGGGRGLGDAGPAPPLRPHQQQQQVVAGRGGQMGWGPRPGMGGPFMPPGMVPGPHDGWTHARHALHAARLPARHGHGRYAASPLNLLLFFLP